jgi:hypothetical protein
MFGKGEEASSEDIDYREPSLEVSYILEELEVERRERTSR